MQIIVVTSPPNWLVQQGIQVEIERHFAEQPNKTLPHDHRCLLQCWGTALDTIYMSQFRPAVEAILN